MHQSLHKLYDLYDQKTENLYQIVEYEDPRSRFGSRYSQTVDQLIPNLISGGYGTMRIYEGELIIHIRTNGRLVKHIKESAGVAHLYGHVRHIMLFAVLRKSDSQ